MSFANSEKVSNRDSNSLRTARSSFRRCLSRCWYDFLNCVGKPFCELKKLWTLTSTRGPRARRFVWGWNLFSCNMFSFQPRYSYVLWDLVTEFVLNGSCQIWPPTLTVFLFKLWIELLIDPLINFGKRNHFLARDSSWPRDPSTFSRIFKGSTSNASLLRLSISSIPFYITLYFLPEYPQSSPFPTCLPQSLPFQVSSLASFWGSQIAIQNSNFVTLPFIWLLLRKTSELIR